MDHYKEFCQLRDYRKPGAEVCQYTESEAFAMATSKGIAGELVILANQYEQALNRITSMAEKFAATRQSSKGKNAFRDFAAIVRGMKSNPNENKTETWGKK